MKTKLLTLFLMLAVSIGEVYSSLISATDRSISDWNNLPLEYLSSAVCPVDASFQGLRSVKVFADETYIFILAEPNMDVIVDLGWVPFQIFLDTDNKDTTGGYSDMFSDANTDILLDGAVFADGEHFNFNPAVFKWWGEVGGSGWNWTDPTVEHSVDDLWGAIVGEGQRPIGNSQFVNGKIEIQLLRELIPANWNQMEFGIGFDIQQNWIETGVLPQESPTDNNPDGRANKIKVRIYKSMIIDNIAYYLNEGNHTATVISNNYSDSVSIPSQVTFENQKYTVTSIKSNAFLDCINLRSITIPNSVTNIEGNAFKGCTGLTSVTIPNSVTSIGGFAFSSCSSLTSVTLNSDAILRKGRGLKNYFGEQVTEYILEDSVKIIGDYAFSGCANLISVTIPNSVTYIGYYAFYGCSKLTDITIPNSVINIDDYAFSECTGFINIELPNSITVLGRNIFSNCANLTSITMQSETTPIIFPSTFDNIPHLSTIIVPCGSLDAYLNADGWSNYSVYIKNIPSTVRAISSDSTKGYVTFPQTICEEKITAIPHYGCHFSKWKDGCTDNPRIINPADDTTYIAFFEYDNYGLCGISFVLTWEYNSEKKVLTISGTGDLTANKIYGVEAIGEMTSLVIEEGVGIIGDSAFANIPTLTTVKIGKDVRKIQDYAFGNCYHLASIYNYRPTPATISANTFEEVDKYACTLYVLSGSEDMYRSAAGWSEFYNIQPMPADAIDEVISENNSSVVLQKIISNGQLFILLPHGTHYTATGVKVE